MQIESTTSEHTAKFFFDISIAVDAAAAMCFCVCVCVYATRCRQRVASVCARVCRWLAGCGACVFARLWLPISEETEKKRFSSIS